MEQLYDSKLSLDTPIDWWHQLQGGRIAELRPPPPGAGDPYPSLARIPPRPTPPDPATRRTLMASLASQRDRARQLAGQEPIVWPVPGVPTVPGAAPAPKGRSPEQAPPQSAATPAPAAIPERPAPASPALASAQRESPQKEDAETSKLVFGGAEAVPAPRNPPPAAPAPATSPPPAFATPPPPSARPSSSPIPALPEAAPPLPRLAGIPASAAAPASIPRPRPSAQFRFPAGSAALPDAAQSALRALAARLAGGAIQVTAGGDAASSGLNAQQRALPLALRRTAAITAALIAAGVPPGSIRAEAVAPGREGVARLID